MSFERSALSKKRLALRWDNVLPSGEESLDFQSALKEIRGTDPRPLIVLRECDLCRGRDDALLNKTMNNELVKLATQWFHMVKLDRRVIEKGHPYHALFDGDKPPHLFITDFDGSNILALPGNQSQKKTWSALTKILKLDYKKNPVTAVKEWRKILNKFDSIESQAKGVHEQLANAEKKYGRKSRQAKKLGAKLAKLDQERSRAFAREKKVMNLILRRAPKVKTALDYDSEAATEVKASSGSSLLERIRKKKADPDRPSDKAKEN